MTNYQLELFLIKFEIIFGLEFNTQQEIVLTKLCKLFNCEKHVADSHYYNNALRIVIDKAINPNVSQRIITRAEFFKSVDSKKKLFNAWYIELRTKDGYLDLIKKRIKKVNVLRPSISKFVIIGNDVLSTECPEMPLAIFIENLIDKYGNGLIALIFKKESVNEKSNHRIMNQNGFGKAYCSASQSLDACSERQMLPLQTL